jgi:transcriptional regulator with XRE-family HTH domain
MGSQATFQVGRAGLVVVLSDLAVKEACAERGWSLSELARRAGISRPTLATALQGHPVRARTAWKLAKALEQGAPTQLSRLLEAV